MYVEPSLHLWDKATSDGKKFGGEDLFDPLKMKIWKEVRLQLVICYRFGNKTVGMNLEEKKEEIMIYP